jgi:hypothetical protein
MKAVARGTALEKFMAVITWLTHGDQHKASTTALSTMRRLVNTADEKFQHSRLKEKLDLWPSIFSGVTLITNRATPLHRDTNGFKAGFDYLTVAGSARSILALPDINMTCEYNPGTVVAIAGRVLRHEADRIHAPNCAGADENGRNICVCADRTGGEDCICEERINSGTCGCENTVGSGDRLCSARWIRQKILQEYGGMEGADLGWSTISAVEERMRMCMLP